MDLETRVARLEKIISQLHEGADACDHPEELLENITAAGSKNRTYVCNACGEIVEQSYPAQPPN